MASLLETFFILFETNSKEAEKGLSDVSKKAEEAGEELGDAEKKAKELDQKRFDAVSQSMRGFVSDVKKGIIALASIAAAKQAFGSLLENASGLVQIQQTAETLGVAVDRLHAFGAAAQRTGGDMQGAFDSLTDMTESIGEALRETDSQRAKTFAALGISLRDASGQAKDAVTGMLDLADAVQGLSRQEAVFRIKELGITDNRTVEMLLQGREALEDLMATQRRFGVISKEQVETAQRFDRAWTDLTMTMGGIGREIAHAVMPALQSVIEWLTRAIAWVRDHRALVIGFFAGAAVAVATLLTPALSTAAVAAWALLAPILAIAAPIIAAAAAVALLVDDFMAWREGSESLLGQLFGDFEKFEPILNEIGDVFKTVFTVAKDAIGEALGVLKELGGFLLEVAGFLVSELVVAGTRLADAFLSMWAVVKPVLTALWNFGAPIRDSFIEAGQSILQVFTGIFDRIFGWIERLGGFLRRFARERTAANFREAQATHARLGGDQSGVGARAVAAAARVAEDRAQEAAPRRAAPAPVSLNLSVEDKAPPAAAATPLPQAMEKGQGMLAAAQSAPLTSQTSNSIQNSNRSSNRTVTQTNNVTVQTNATDPAATGDAVSSALSEQMRSAVDNFDDGVVA